MWRVCLWLVLLMGPALSQDRITPDKSRVFEVEGPENALRVSFEDVNLRAPLGLEVLPATAEQLLPERIRKLSGKTIRVTGAMYPPDKDAGLKGFLLVHPGSFLRVLDGGQHADAKFAVRMREGTTTDYVQGRTIEVVGTFRVQSRVHDGKLLFLYLMDDAIMPEEPPETSVFSSQWGRVPLRLRLEKSDVVVVADAVNRNDRSMVESEYIIQKILSDSSRSLSIGQVVRLPRRLHLRTEQRVLLFAKGPSELSWYRPVDIAESTSDYLAQMPPAGTEERWAYLVSFLNSHNDLIANDAHDLLQGATGPQLAALRDKLPVEQLRQWLAQPNSVAFRARLNARLLGHCGTRDDAKSFQEAIDAAWDNQAGLLSDLMAGYLILVGDEGLPIVERVMQGEFRHRHAALSSLQMAWNETDRLSRNRVLELFRRMASDPQLDDLAIFQLAQGHDWSAIDQLEQLYESLPITPNATRRAIIRYLIEAETFQPSDGVVTPDLAKARSVLTKLRERDTDAVQDVEEHYRSSKTE